MNSKLKQLMLLSGVIIGGASEHLCANETTDSGIRESARNDRVYFRSLREFWRSSARQPNSHVSNCNSGCHIAPSTTTTTTTIDENTVQPFDVGQMSNHACSTGSEN